MASVEAITEEDDGVTNITFNLTKDEMSLLIFAGMSESEYDTTLIGEYDPSLKQTMAEYADFVEACADNGVTEEEGFLHIQVGIQTAIVAGINAMNKRMEDLDQEGECGVTSNDHQDHIVPD